MMVESFASPIELYAAPLCPFAHRTRLTLSEKNISARVVDIDLRNKPAGFLRLSPQGKVPLLKIGDDCLWESAVIDEYLEEMAPEPALLPDGAFQRARARAWIRFADTRLYANTERLLHAGSDESRTVALAAIHEDLRYLADHAFARAANGGPYWMGAQFTLVDVTFFPWFEQSTVLEKFFGLQWPAKVDELRRWQEQVAARPAVRAESRPPSFYLGAYAALAKPKAGH